MTLRDYLFSLVEKLKRKKGLEGGQANSDDGIYRVLYEETIDKSYSILDVEVKNDKITFCETWGGPRNRKGLGRF